MAIATALNTARANLANQIDTPINERRRRDRQPDYRNRVSFPSSKFEKGEEENPVK